LEGRYWLLWGGGHLSLKTIKGTKKGRRGGPN